MELDKTLYFVRSKIYHFRIKKKKNSANVRACISRIMPRGRMGM